MAKQKVILIVDDEPAILKALSDKFKKEDFSIIEARDGEAGLKAALENRPDLILLDVIMPKMDGIEVLTKLREDDWGKDAKVIILTNLSDEQRVSDALGQGSYEYLIKSNWHIEKLVEKVRSILGIK